MAVDLLLEDREVGTQRVRRRAPARATFGSVVSVIAIRPG